MKKGDFILITTLLILFLSLFVFINYNYKDNSNKYVSVQVNGKEIKKITFGNGKKIYPIRTSYGINVLEIDSEGVRVIEASCPDKLDVKYGKIKYIGQAIVCLPNRLVVQIKSNDNLEMDVIN